MRILHNALTSMLQTLEAEAQGSFMASKQASVLLSYLSTLISNSFIQALLGTTSVKSSLWISNYDYAFAIDNKNMETEGQKLTEVSSTAYTLWFSHRKHPLIWLLSVSDLPHQQLLIIETSWMVCLSSVYQILKRPLQFQTLELFFCEQNRDLTTIVLLTL